MDDDLRDLLTVSRAVGTDPRLVQGGGGNTSAKSRTGDRMYVKASGTALADMQEGRGYRLVAVQRCTAILDDARLVELDPEAREAEVLARLVECCTDDLEGRPSVETSLHALLGRCVVHTHPSIVNGLLCAADGRRALERLFARLDPPVLYLEFCGAGYSLAMRMRAELQRYLAAHGRLPEVVLLENHGLFVAADEADRALELTREVCRRVEQAAGEAKAAARAGEFRPLEAGRARALVEQAAAVLRRFYSRCMGGPALVEFDDGPAVREFLRLPQAEALAQVSPLSPDQVVYCRDHPVWVGLPEDDAQLVPALEAALSAAEAGENTPLCVLVGGLGLFCAAPTAGLLGAVTAMMRAALETLSVAAHFGGARGLSPEAVEWMHNWEVERFRRRLATGRREEQDLAGKVALVTGAGSGLGRGIAIHLAGLGVHVALADIDADGARETQRRIADAGSAALAVPLRVDVTSEGSVSDLVHAVVRRFGGVDLLVNCAGVAPAHPLVEFPLDAWRRALEVNLTGYFLVAREAARCMVRQGTGGSIVNVSSKSGLEPSRNNSAYCATKAGEIHMARGWALELAEHGIRVNCVCPGNVFKESRIWNEDYIRAAAQKRGIRPEEVIPYYISLTALKQEVTWDDVGAAVAFLAGPGAAKITGQTLVVDAGQVFVR